MHPTFENLREVLEMALDKKAVGVTPDTDFYEELGMDSIGIVSMAVEIHRRFGVRLSESQLMVTRTIEDLISAIEKSWTEESIDSKT